MIAVMNVASAEHPDHRQHEPPADEIAEDSGHWGAEQVAEHAGGQQPADRDLALMHRHEIAGERERDREDAAGRDTGRDPGREQERKFGAAAPAKPAITRAPRQMVISRVLPIMSASGPSTGCSPA